VSRGGVFWSRRSASSRSTRLTASCRVSPPNSTRSQGTTEAESEVVEVAELLGAGVAKALLGREALPDDLPWVTGPIGLLGSTVSDEMMRHCDTLFMIGTSFPYSEWLPKEGQARGVEIDIDGRMIGMRYPMDAHLVGDAKETLRALIPLLRRKEDRTWRERIEKSVQE
jgi:pyruvate dehydrogenase (quinone)